ncbi:hypothetical protein B0I35DRAFT_359899 [Stachybotrys elegans]|uniref:Zn(2)-C6 fungal-type domain-containing protein n=1 Tax=Stachybotrys elegans TaxID=80388 RepID=A0A8K0SIQ8_9HYPO|nr:hypothetical protein B0I35DRAFT_359899 [Stachybotrys elegans]
MPSPQVQQHTSVFRAAGSSRVQRNRQAVSCTSCQKRKARCDRRHPCSSCEKRGDEASCSYGPAAAAAAASPGRASGAHRSEVAARLTRLEEMVRSFAANSPAYHGPTSWAALVEGIQGIQSALELEDEAASIETPDMDFLSVDLSPVTMEDVVRCLPPRRTVDRLVRICFKSRSMALPCIHTHHFQRRYEAFWESPSTTNMLWASILLSMVAAGAVIAAKKESPSSPALTDLAEPRVYMAMAARCLKSGKFLEAKAYSVEAVLVHLHFSMMLKKDSDPALWSLYALPVRLAQRRGYHRDAAKAALDISPFEAEMRRRTWLMVRFFDLTFSFQHGVPSLVSEADCDVGHPTMLTDDDFDESSTSLPAPRPPTDPHPIVCQVWKSKFMLILGRLHRRALRVSPSPPGEAAQLEADMDAWHDSIPACLRYRTMRETSFGDAGDIIMYRCLLELMYLMGKCILYCPYLNAGDGVWRDPMALCCDSAVKILLIHQEIEQETQPGGRLHEDWCMISSLTLGDCLNAAMVVCADLVQSQDQSPSDKEWKVDLIRTAYRMWLARSHDSNDAVFACRVIRAILRRLGAEPPSQTDSQPSLGENRHCMQSNLSVWDDHSVQDSTRIIMAAPVSIPESSTSVTLYAVNEPLKLEKSPVPRSAERGSALVQVLSTVVRPHFKAHFEGRGFLSMPPPFQPGNSGIARVLSVGPDAVALVPGQLVFVSGFVTARDDPEDTSVLLGIHRGNGFGTDRAGPLFDSWQGLWREVASVSLESCIALDEERLCGQLGYSFCDLAYLDRLSVAYGSISAAKLIPGETVIVAPATGHFSGAVAEMAAQMGCRVIALTRSKSKLEPLTSRHANITPLELTGEADADVAAIRALCPKGSLGADAFLDISPPEATANPHHFAVGLAALRSKARVICSGFLFNVTIPYGTVMMKSISVIGKWMFSHEEVRQCVRMTEAGTIKLGEAAGHLNWGGGFKFQDWEEALVEAEKAMAWGQHVLFTP